MKKLLVLFILIFFTPFALAASTHQLQKLRVILDWSPNPDHAPLIIAIQQGFFKDQGLDVQMITPKDTTDVAKLIITGKADIGIDYQSKLVTEIKSGLPLVQVGTLIDKPLDCLIALKNSKIDTISDLKGKRIGISNAGFSHLSLKIMLNQKGLQESDVQIISVGDSAIQALLSHQVDAIIGVMRNFEVPELELNGHAVTVFFPEEHGVQNYSELVFVAKRTNANDNRIPRFLTAIKRATAYLDEHPEETWKQFIAQYPQSNNEINTRNIQS
jgi:putative hydroxymethylpyrimidine transport system substrate-binding protein